MLQGWRKAAVTLEDADLSLLSKEFSKKELKRVVDHLGNNISQSIDGITYYFIKFYLKIISEDVSRTFSQYFSTGMMYPSWKETLIALIPKVSNPMSPSNYRPISLFLYIYKLVAKLLLKTL